MGLEGEQSRSSGREYQGSRQAQEFPVRLLLDQVLEIIGVS